MSESSLHAASPAVAPSTGAFEPADIAAAAQLQRRSTRIEVPPADSWGADEEVTPRQSSATFITGENGDGRYTRPEIPFDLASSGDVLLLSYRWLEELAASGKPLSRRQDLPPAAFVDVDALRASHAALPAHIAAAVLPLLSISYCWLDPVSTGRLDPADSRAKLCKSGVTCFCVHHVRA